MQFGIVVHGTNLGVKEFGIEVLHECEHALPIFLSFFLGFLWITKCLILLVLINFIIIFWCQLVVIIVVIIIIWCDIILVIRCELFSFLFSLRFLLLKLLFRFFFHHFRFLLLNLWAPLHVRVFWCHQIIDAFQVSILHLNLASLHLYASEELLVKFWLC